VLGRPRPLQTSYPIAPALAQTLILMVPRSSIMSKGLARAFEPGPCPHGQPVVVGTLCMSARSIILVTVIAPAGSPGERGYR
jgi:hypothetical protein